jgi:ADP-ribose pyrophosphatase YjhB (NUDIX family)
MMLRADRDWPYHVSAGGVVYREVNGQLQIALLESKNHRDFAWHLPKGTLNDDETLEQGAVREVAEESGLISEIEAYLGATQYTLPKEIEGFIIHKTVHYFLMRFRQDSAAGMDGEYDSCHWLSLREAKVKLQGSYKSEDEVLDRAEKWLAAHAE